MEKKKYSLRFVVFCTLFCVALIASNLFEMKVVDFDYFAVTAGMLIFPISYIVNDCIVEIWGYKMAKFAIILAFTMNFLVMAMGGIAILLPSPADWGGAEHFNAVFSLAPRIAVASLTAFLIGSFLNAKVMDKMKRIHKERLFPLRSIVSTVVGECADSIIFFPIAFAGVWPVDELIKMMGIQALFKTLYEVILLPITNRVVRRLRTVEA
ncbi:MAG TPA: queuosine precursor transporter [Bacteroidaceae bacterium]|jgi:uncharacterized integral membrane protein (TIGR00697 family)|nr:queuosine precursor transporter [Bacteroidales bacterium]HBA13496.1 hypothetical protein [Bacteroidales bacterium]HOD69163.1 queuosine precursor transporter [Bacteroidaceae bacterium]HPX98729.1 queuosine precursor transporter [Bacteroidaceae bacterium]HQL26479.1 queuosine precursor transporter [Bacteroidaceae bacterium]